MLATSKLSDEKMGQIERYINYFEQELEQSIALRKVYTHTIQQMEAMLVRAKAMKE